MTLAGWAITVPLTVAVMAIVLAHVVSVSVTNAKVSLTPVAFRAVFKNTVS